jgi:hypothetical protein
VIARWLTVLAVVGMTAGCSASGEVAAKPTPSPSSSVTVTPSPAPSMRSGAADFGYFRDVLSTTKLAFDRATYLSGAEANKAAAQHGEETPVPNDYFIVNDFKVLRTLTLDPRVEVFGSLQLNSFAGSGFSTGKQKRTVAELIGFLRTKQGKVTPFRLLYGAGGRVVRVTEQYVP